MKIYTKIVINIETGEVLHEESFNYSGPIALCGSGGGGSGVDEEYNDRMATIAEAQELMSEEMSDWMWGRSGHWSVGDQTFDSEEEANAYAEESGESATWVDTFGDHTSYMDYQTAMLDANAAMLPGETALSMEQTQAERDLLPGQTALSQEQTQAERNILPGQTALTIAGNQSALSLLPSQTEYEQASLDSALSLLPSQTQAQQAELDQQIFLTPYETSATLAELMNKEAEIYERAPVRSQFYEAASEGVDVEARADAAQADAAQAFMGSEAAMKRDLARTGVNPNSGRYASESTSTAIEKAKTMGSARTQAREDAEEENFSRLQTAMNYGNYGS